MGGEQAAGVLHVVERDKREREGKPWPAEEQEEFKRAIRDRWAIACLTEKVEGSSGLILGLPILRASPCLLAHHSTSACTWLWHAP